MGNKTTNLMCEQSQAKMQPTLGCQGAGGGTRADLEPVRLAALEGAEGVPLPAGTLSAPRTLGVASGLTDGRGGTGWPPVQLVTCPYLPSSPFFTGYAVCECCASGNESRHLHRT